MQDEPRLGVGIIIARGDEILLVRRQGAHGSGTWSTPGGHLDFGETPEQCAVREAWEETGVEIGGVRFRALTNDWFALERKHYITIWMEAEYRGGEATVKATREMSSVGWFQWSRLPAPLFLPLSNLLSGRCYPSSKTTEAPQRLAIHRVSMRRAYRVFGWGLVLLGTVHMLTTFRAFAGLSSSAVWFFGSGIAMCLTGVLNLLNHAYGRAAHGLRRTTVATNAWMTAFAIVAGAATRATIGEFVVILGLIGGATLLSAFDYRFAPARET